MHSSAGSTRSNRAKTRQYRTVSHKSQVDESLFGQPSKPTHNINNSNTMVDDMFATEPQPARQRRSGNKKPKKETVQVITKDLIRNLM